MFPPFAEPFYCLKAGYLQVNYSLSRLRRCSQQCRNCSLGVRVHVCNCLFTTVLAVFSNWPWNTSPLTAIMVSNCTIHSSRCSCMCRSENVLDEMESTVKLIYFCITLNCWTRIYGIKNVPPSAQVLYENPVIYINMYTIYVCIYTYYELYLHLQTLICNVVI